MREEGTRKPKSYQSTLILVNDVPNDKRLSSHTEIDYNSDVSLEHKFSQVFETQKIFENNTSY